MGHRRLTLHLQSSLALARAEAFSLWGRWSLNPPAPPRNHPPVPLYSRPTSHPELTHAHRKPVARDVAEPPRPAAVRQAEARALPPGLRRRDGGPACRHRCHHRSQRAGDLRQHQSCRWNCRGSASTGCRRLFHLSAADTSDALQAVEREIAPVLARHGSAVALNEPLFRRIAAVWQARDQLDAERKRVVDRTHTSFVRSGAALDAAGKQRLAAITERLAEIGTQFGQNVLADESAFRLVLDGPADLAGAAGIGRRRGGGKRRASAACRANTSSRCRAPRSSRSSPSRRAATFARKPSTPG